METTDFEEKTTSTIDEKPVEEQAAKIEPVVITVKIKPTAADRRYKLHLLSDALVIAPRKDRKFANNVISVITNSTKIERRTDLEEKKQSMPTQIYDVDELRLEIECKPQNSDKHNYTQPRMITVINRKSKKIVDRITKPYLVGRVNSILINTYDKIVHSQKALESARATIQKLSEYQAQK